MRFFQARAHSIVMPPSTITARTASRPSAGLRCFGNAPIYNPNQIRQRVMDGGYDVLSIDLFDTLVYRRCAQPDRVFALQHAAIHRALTLNEDEWVRLRKSVERDVTTKHSPRESHFDEIYAAIGHRLDLDASVVNQLKNAELEVERNVIAPFQDVVSVVNQLINAGTTVIVTTDMYLPIEFLRAILSEFLDARAQLICSSETGAPKRTGLAYRLLKERFPGRAILHIGDNLHSDVQMASKSGVDAALVLWDRREWMQRNRRYTEYLESLGVRRFETPADESESVSLKRARIELAWRWSIVLFDFLLELRKYARQSGADEIWFLSRDGESLYAAASDNPGFFGNLAVKYIYTSRAATYPMFALSSNFEQIAGRPPTPDDEASGKDLVSVYRRLLGESTRRVVLVDAGWKGRLQAALHEQLPGVDFRGFYFSLDPTAESAARADSQCFVPFDPATICGAAVESLLGYQKGSCKGYAKSTDDAWTPIIDEGRDDVAPADYCLALRRFLSELLRSEHAHPSKLRTRLNIVRAICMYPDQITARALGNWSIGVKVGGGDAGGLISGGRSYWLGRLVGSTKNGNLWPSAAAWSLLRVPHLVRAIQTQIRWSKAILFRLTLFESVIRRAIAHRMRPRVVSGPM